MKSDEESLFLQLEDNRSDMESIDDDSIIPIDNHEMQGLEFEESPIVVSNDSNDDEKIENENIEKIEDEDSFNASNGMDLGQDDSLIDRLSNLEE